jgi:hypothetical protein
MWAMFRARQDFLLPRAVALQLVRYDHPWHVGQALEQPPEELLGGFSVPLTLDENIQDVAVLIHGTPQIVVFAVNREEYLIQVPLVARPGAPPELMGLPQPQLPAPLANGLIRHDDFPLGQ